MIANSQPGGRLLVIVVLLGVLLACGAPAQPQPASGPDAAAPTSMPASIATAAPPATAPPIATAAATSAAASPAPASPMAAAGSPMAAAGSPTPAPPAPVASATVPPTTVAAAPAPAAPTAPAPTAAVFDAVPPRAAESAPPDPGEPAPASPTRTPTGYVARSPEYGMHVFLAGNPATTARDLALLNRVDFEWQKSLFQWRQIEGVGKGVFDWRDADRVVAASRSAGVKIIARLDFQPRWARADRANNSPPDDYQDYADFVHAFVERYRAGSPRGTVHAIQVWNEPNLTREWGGEPINRAQAADYVRLLRAAYDAAKLADPSITVISAGLSPTCTDDQTARPDDLYLQWLYDAGAAPYFDVLGAHGAGYDKPPEASPEESAARHNGCRVFAFRRVEDLRRTMERNGDAHKQVWLLEFGWTTDRQHPAYAWHAITPEVHGEYLVGAYRWAHEHWAPWIGVMVLWNLPDPSWGPDREEYWWGVANPDGTPRPALDRLRAARRDGHLP